MMKCFYKQGKEKKTKIKRFFNDRPNPKLKPLDKVKKFKGKILVLD